MLRASSEVRSQVSVHEQLTRPGGSRGGFTETMSLPLNSGDRGGGGGEEALRCQSAGGLNMKEVLGDHSPPT